MTMLETTLLNSITEMAEQTPSVGLCPAPFRTMHALVWEIVKERDELMRYREPQTATGGKCPRCGRFVDPYDNYCGDCGQRIVSEERGEC